MRERTFWTWHLAAGLVILVLLGLHMAIMHLNVPLGLTGANPAGDDPLAWGNVAHRSRQVFFTASYIVLLGAALYHGLYGLRNILGELDPSPRLRQVITVVLVVVGAGIFALGTWAALTARTVAQAAGF